MVDGVCNSLPLPLRYSKHTWGKRPVPAEVPTALTPHSMLARMAEPFIWMRPSVLAKG